MAFGNNIFEKGLSSYEKAIARIQEGNQEVNISVNTKEKDGRFFLFDMEVSESEYHKFLEAYNNALELRNKTHEMAGGEEEEDYKIAA